MTDTDTTTPAAEREDDLKDHGIVDWQPTALVSTDEHAPAPIVVGPETGILGIIERHAGDPNFDIGKFERLVTLYETQQEKQLDREARAAYTAAMATFKANAPILKKNASAAFKTRAGQQVAYTYATLDVLTETLTPLLGRYGLSFRWELDQQPNYVKASCIMTHRHGYQERAEFVSAIETSTSASTAQANASAATYAKRQSLTSLIGLAPSEDDDGVAAGAAPEDIAEQSPARQRQARPPQDRPSAAAQASAPADTSRAICPTHGDDSIRKTRAKGGTNKGRDIYTCTVRTDGKYCTWEIPTSKAPVEDEPRSEQQRPAAPPANDQPVDMNLTRLIKLVTKERVTAGLEWAHIAAALDVESPPSKTAIQAWILADGNIEAEAVKNLITIALGIKMAAVALEAEIKVATEALEEAPLGDHDGS